MTDVETEQTLNTSAATVRGFSVKAAEVEFYWPVIDSTEIKSYFLIRSKHPLYVSYCYRTHEMIKNRQLTEPTECSPDLNPHSSEPQSSIVF